jgi:hypothetical protein
MPNPSARIGNSEFDLKLTDRVKMCMVGVPEQNFEMWCVSPGLLDPALPRHAEPGLLRRVVQGGQVSCGGLCVPPTEAAADHRRADGTSSPRPPTDKVGRVEQAETALA